MSDLPKSSRRSTSATPADFPVQSPQQQLPGADYSYTVELVGAIQYSLGKLTEAVDSLKEQTKEHGKELKSIGRDLHAAKVVGSLLVLLAGGLGWGIHEVVQYLYTHAK